MSRANPLLPALFVVLWSTGFIAAKYGLPYTPPLKFLLVRFALVTALMSVVALLEKELGRSAQKEMLPMQPGDVPITFADIDDLIREVGFRPSTSLEDGIHRFAAWYCRYHRVGHL